MGIASKLFWLFIAGGLGAVSRVGLSTLVIRWFPSQPFWGTLSVNVSGCFLFGLVWGASQGRWQGAPEIPFLLMAGFLGAFTTFSSYIYDSQRLWEAQGVLLALLNLAGQILLGLLAFGLAVKWMQLEM